MRARYRARGPVRIPRKYPPDRTVPRLAPLTRERTRVTRQLPLPVSGPVFPVRFSSPCRRRSGRRPSWWRLLRCGPCRKSDDEGRVHERPLDARGKPRGKEKKKKKTPADGVDATLLVRQGDARDPRAA